MAGTIVNQFSGLPLQDLIAGPLMAASDAQVKLAQATAAFIQTVGFVNDQDPAKSTVRNVTFQFRRPTGAEPEAGGAVPTELVTMDVPLLSIVKVPALSIVNVDITFNMEVKEATSDTSDTTKQASAQFQAGGGWGPFSAKLSISGSVSSTTKSERTTDSSAKYNVVVKAEDKGMPEGLARVLDIMASAIAPTNVKQ